MPEEQTQPQVLPQQAKSISWSKIVVTVLIIAVVGGLITGALWYFVLGKSSPEVSNEPVKKASISTKQATKSATPSAKKDETADWQTYKGKINVVQDEENYINGSFKYPKGYTQSKDEYSRIYLKNFVGIEIKAEDLALFVDIIETSSVSSVVKDYNGKITDTMIGSVVAKRYTTSSSASEGTSKTVTFISNSTKSGYSLQMRCTYVYNATDLDKTCDLIASTFKFLD